MDLFQLIADQAPDAISVHELDGRYRWASPMFAHLLGLEPDSLVGRDAYELFHPQDLLAIRDSHGVVLEQGDLAAVQYRIRRSDGTYRWVETTSRLVPEDQVIVSVTRPIDVRRSAMTALGTERLLAARVKQVDEQRRQFMTAIAHRARHPITIVRGMAELLAHRADQMSDAQRTMAVDRIFANAKELQQLIEDVTQAEALARRAARVQVRPLPLGNLVEQVIAEVAADDAPITVTIRPHEVLFGDEKLIRLALRLLLDNALAHTPIGTPIWIQLERRQDGACLIVEDAGPGVPQSQRQFIFEPFQRIEAEDADPGLGLGLHTVAEIAAQHGGRVWVEDRVGGGASFRLLLPAAAADRTRHRPEILEADNEPIHLREQLVRVLVVDDDPNMTAMLKMALEGEGFDVEVATTGQEGLDQASSGSPDVIVLDAMLRDLDGREVCERIRTQMASDVPILMFSALADPRHETEAIRSGVNVFLAKTVGVGTLIRELRRLIAFTETVGAPKPSIEDEVHR